MTIINRVTVWVIAIALVFGVSGGVVIAQDAGIKVHGNWTIEVRESDGTLVSHTRFKNAFVPASGTLPLAVVLANQGTITGWMLTLLGPEGLCEPTPPDREDCQIRMPTATPSATGLVISGEVVPKHAGTIVSVDSRVLLSSPLGNGGGVFTRAAIPPISVAAGQSIRVTFTLTFS